MFFAILGTKELRMKDLELIEAQIPIALCKIEKEFPPAFFDVMVHLLYNLLMKLNLVGQSNLDICIQPSRLCIHINPTFAIGLNQRAQLQRAI